MLQRLKPILSCSLLLGTIAFLLVMVSRSKNSNPNALLLTYHFLVLALLPLLCLCWHTSYESLWIALILAELVLLWGQAFSLPALIFLLTLTLFLQAIFALFQKKSSLETAQTFLPFLFYLSIAPIFLADEILYGLPNPMRSWVIQGLIYTNPLILMAGSILEQKEFFRFYYLYNTLSDIGSYYPHRFPSMFWVLGTSGILTVCAWSTFFLMEKISFSKSSS